MGTTQQPLERTPAHRPAPILALHITLVASATMADFNAVAQQFTEFYYKTFDSDRAQLAPLYRDNSMLTFEQSPFLGTANIITKLQELPFQRIEHQVATVDAQPSNESGGILVVVSGALLVEEERRPMSYTQTPVAPRRRQLLRLQRHLPPRVPRRLNSATA